MSEQQFTPGPWEAHRSKLNDLWTVYASQSKNVAAVHDPYGNDDAVSEANAKLIAAAPEMFAALVKIADAYDKAAWMDEIALCMRQAIDAINLARGES